MEKKNNFIIKDIVKFIATIISWTVLVILVLLALFLLYYTIGSKLADKYNEKFEPVISLYSIISPSMTPNINVGDVIVSKKVKSPNDIKKGDIITFTSTSAISNGMTITHRVIDVNYNGEETSYKTKGDNNLSPDSAPAEYGNVLGKVIFRIPKLGQVQNLLANKAGWLLVVIVPALFIIVTDILKVLKLIGVKNKLEKIDEEESKIKNERIKFESFRKEQIKKRLKIDDDSFEKKDINEFLEEHRKDNDIDEE